MLCSLLFSIGIIHNVDTLEISPKPQLTFPLLLSTAIQYLWSLARLPFSKHSLLIICFGLASFRSSRELKIVSWYLRVVLSSSILSLIVFIPPLSARLSSTLLSLSLFLKTRYTTPCPGNFSWLHGKPPKILWRILTFLSPLLNSLVVIYACSKFIITGFFFSELWVKQLFCSSWLIVCLVGCGWMDCMGCTSYMSFSGFVE